MQIGLLTGIVRSWRTTGENTPPTRACRSAMRVFLEQPADKPVAWVPGGADMSIELTVTCSLSPSADVNREEVLHIAEARRLAVSQEGGEPELQVAALTASTMALYRCGRFQNALTTAARAGGKDVDTVCSLLFRAMASQQLGDNAQAQTMLDEARKKSAGELSANKNYDHLKVCLPIIMEEAEDLIRPETKGGGRQQ